VERHPPTQRPNNTACRAWRGVPDATSRSLRAKPTAGGAGYPAAVTIRHETGSSADQVGAEFTLQQIHQRFPVLGGRLGRPQVRLGLLDRAEDGGGGVVVDDP